MVGSGIWKKSGSELAKNISGIGIRVDKKKCPGSRDRGWPKKCPESGSGLTKNVSGIGIGVDKKKCPGSRDWGWQKKCPGSGSGLTKKCPGSGSESLLEPSLWWHVVDVSDRHLRRLVTAFGHLRSMADEGQLAYPYSTRELVNIVRHLQVHLHSLDISNDSSTHSAISPRWNIRSGEKCFRFRRFRPGYFEGRVRCVAETWNNHG